MNPDTLTSAGELVGFLLIGGYTAFKARRADHQTRNTGNGFADFVRDSFEDMTDKLDRLERRIIRVEDKQDMEHGERLRAILEAKRAQAAE